MKSVKIDLSEKLEQVEIHTFSDWHIGDPSCLREDIQAQIDAVKNNPNAYVICNGDLMNNATKTSVSDSYSEVIPPMEALMELTAMLAPIKDKILMILQGNHEARTYRTDGIDLSYLIARNLGIEERYCKEGGVLFLRFGKSKNRNTYGKKQYYTIYATHGSGGGRKEGSKAIRLADMASIVDTDIYLHSHTHLGMIIRQSFFRVNDVHSDVYKVDKLFVNTASQLGGYGGYGQTFEFKPSSTVTPIIYLRGDSKKFWASL